MSATPPTIEQLERAVYVLEDWSGGQFYIYDDPDPYYTDKYEELAWFSTIALTYRAQQLSSWATEVAQRIIALTPPTIERCHAILEKDRLRAEKYLRSATADRPGFVYLLQSPTGAYKIGRTVNPDDRLKTFSVKLPFEVEYTCVISTGDMYVLESELHNRFASRRINGEWFELTPDDVTYIKGLAE